MASIAELNRVCPSCGRGRVEADAVRGELYCSHCGAVLNERAEEEGPEWRTFSTDVEEGGRSRTGAPLSLATHDMGLATMISSRDADATGRSISGKSRAMMERLRTWDRRSQVHRPVDHSLRRAFDAIGRVADKLTIGDTVVERAAYVYRKALAKGLTKGRPIPALATAGLYIACRDTGTIRNLKDMAAASNISRKELARCYRLLIKELDLKMPVSDPIKCVTRIASNARISERTARRAIGLLKHAIEEGATVGKDPMGIAAAALYTACQIEGELKGQRELAQAAGVTEVTIRNRYKSLRAVKGIRAQLLGPISAQQR